MKRKEIKRFIKDDFSKTKVFDKANKIREEIFQNKVHLRGLIEFSNYCVKNCLYCGLRRDNKNIRRYRMSVKDIMSCAKKAYDMGFKTIVLQSGEDPCFSIADLCDTIYIIKKKYNLRITLSIGLLSKANYYDLKNSGADRYLLKFETSNERLYRYLKPDSNFGDRLKAIDVLKVLGYQVGSGIMAGLPGQSDDIIANDIELIRNLNLDMVSVGPFVPNQSTPLANSKTIDESKMLKIIATTRLASPFSHMPATSSMGVLFADGRKKALMCGANVVMPNITPTKYSKNYIIYPGKNIKDPEDGVEELKKMLLSISRSVSLDYGDSLIGVVYERNGS